MTFNFKQNTVSGCSGCPLNGQPRVNPEIVPGAKVLLVGEAPANEEVEKHRVFVGQSGVILRGAVEKAGLVCSITNVIKCFLPREMQTDESIRVRCGHLFLMKEIEQIKPKVIVCLGRSAESFFFPKQVQRNIPYDWNGIKVISTYHPANILHTEGRLNSWHGRDVYGKILSALRLAKVLSEGKSFAVNVSVLPSADVVTKTLSGLDWKHVSFDIETNMKHPWDSKFEMRTIAVSDGRVSYAFQWVPEVIEATKRLLQRAERIIAFNTPFDTMGLLRYGIDLLGKPLDDVMLMSYLLDENLSQYDLKTLTRTRIGEYSVLVTDFVRCSIQDLLLYNGEDALYTGMLFNMLYDEISADGRLLNAYNDVVRPAINVVTSMIYYGFPIDRKRVKECYIKLSTLLEKKAADIQYEIGGDPGSPIVLGRYFQQIKKYPVAKWTESRQPSFDEEAMNEYAQLERQQGAKGIANEILEFRSIKKLLTTYVVPYLDLPDDMIHGQFDLRGTVTGRLSCRNPNLQNIPRDSEIKAFFVSRHPRVLLQSDLSQAELRVGCSLANERTMIATYMRDEDIHVATASIIFRIPKEQVTKSQRQLCKSINFGLLYGQSTDGFVRYLKRKADMVVSWEQADKWRTLFFQTYQDLNAWYEAVKSTLAQNRFVYSPFGRMRRFPDLAPPGSPAFDASFREAVNFPVQSAASDINLQAMIAVYKRIQRDKLESKIRILSTVHDSMIMEIEESQIKMITNVILLSINRYGWLHVPMKADFVVGTNWKEMQPLKG